MGQKPAGPPPPIRTRPRCGPHGSGAGPTARRRPARRRFGNAEPGGPPRIPRLGWNHPVRRPAPRRARLRKPLPGRPGASGGNLPDPPSPKPASVVRGGGAPKAGRPHRAVEEVARPITRPGFPGRSPDHGPGPGVSCGGLDGGFPAAHGRGASGCHHPAAGRCVRRARGRRRSPARTRSASPGGSDAPHPPRNRTRRGASSPRTPSGARSRTVSGSVNFRTRECPEMRNHAKIPFRTTHMRFLPHGVFCGAGSREQVALVIGCGSYAGSATNDTRSLAFILPERMHLLRLRRFHTT